MMKYDVEDISKVFITDPKIMSVDAEVLIRMVNYHLELYFDLKPILPPEEIHLEVLDVNQMLGSYHDLNNLTKIFKGKKKRYGMSIFLLCVVVAKISGNNNPTFPLKAYRFFLGLSCLSNKAFEIVYGNLPGPYL